MLDLRIKQWCSFHFILTIRLNKSKLACQYGRQKTYALPMEGTLDIPTSEIDHTVESGT